MRRREIGLRSRYRDRVSGYVGVLKKIKKCHNKTTFWMPIINKCVRWQVPVLSVECVSAGTKQPTVIWPWRSSPCRMSSGWSKWNTWRTRRISSQRSGILSSSICKSLFAESFYAGKVSGWSNNVVLRAPLKV